MEKVTIMMDLEDAVDLMMELKFRKNDLLEKRSRYEEKPNKKLDLLDWIDSEIKSIDRSIEAFDKVIFRK